MKRRHRTTRTSPAGAVAAVAWALTIALCFALVMLGHATGAHSTQWAEGAFTGCLVGLAGALFVGLTSTVFALQDARDQEQLERAVAKLGTWAAR
jgi:protein-S-isoprenylcysteine O-methyltransferase Ste14